VVHAKERSWRSLMRFIRFWTYGSLSARLSRTGTRRWNQCHPPSCLFRGGALCANMSDTTHSAKSVERWSRGFSRILGRKEPPEGSNPSSPLLNNHVVGNHQLQLR
jgi:hypothetical protein